VDDALARLERAARERGEARRRPGPERRSAVCEMCGGGDVTWGAMCQPCRGRLHGVPAPGGAGDDLRSAASGRAPARPGLSLIENVPGVVYRCADDVRRTVLFATEGLGHLTGTPAAAFRGGALGLADVVHPEDRPVLDTALARAGAAGAIDAEYRVVRTDGAVRWVQDRARRVAGDTGWILDGLLVDVTERRRAQDELAWLALHDPLTRLPNRRALEARLAMETARARAAVQPLALAVLDLDAFKAVNDAHGHGVGDRVLVDLAARLRAGTPPEGLAARIGGEEFVILLPGRSLASALAVAEAVRRAVEAAPVGGLPGVTISAGVAEGARPDLLAAADAALYRAKRAGRNRVVTG